MSQQHHEELNQSTVNDHSDRKKSGSKKKKKKKKKRHSLADNAVERSKKYGKEKDLFPELTALPEFTDYKKSYAGGDDDSLKSGSSRYDTKEDQDVAVFMALAGRMNIDSLLFLLNGHAREMNLPSADLLLPENAAKLEAQREAAKRAKKKFQWKEDVNGNVALEIFEIEPMKDADMWFDDEFSDKIRMGAIRDVQYYQANKRDYINAVETLATQPDSDETEGHMKCVINDKHARGLEVHICGYTAEIRRDFINAVLDEQDDCEDNMEDYETTAARLRQAGLPFTVLSQEFAYKLAKCDHIVALKASLSKWDKPKTSSSKKPAKAISRCKDGDGRERKRKSSKEGTVA